MKRLKALFSALVAMFMVFSMSGTAIAQTVTVGTTDQGSITIKNATVGKKYTIYKLFDANPSGNNDSKIAYTATESVYNWLSKDEAAKDLFKFTKNTANTYNVEQNGTGEEIDKAIKTFLNSLITENGNTVTVNENLAALKIGDETEANDAILTFNKIPYGYYVVQSSLGAVVSVDSTNKNVTIIDKNQSGPTWDIDNHGTGKAFTDKNGNVKTAQDGSTVTVNSANYGDIVYYAIGVNTTNYDGADQIINYFISDTIDAGLSYNKDSLVVKVGDNTLASTAYTIEYGQNDKSFEITIPWVNDANSIYSSPSSIRVTYNATVTEQAGIAGDGNKNIANYTYQTTQDQDKKPYDDKNEHSTTTYVYALGLLKVATKTGNTNTTLPGAKFTVTDNNNNPINVVTTDVPGEYKFDTRADGNGVTRSNEVVTPDSGVIIIKGLAAGTYKLTETEAPATYNLLTNPVEMVASLSETKNYKQTIITHYDSDGHVIGSEVEGGSQVITQTTVNVVPVTVENYQGTELPSTGGIGTTIFYIVGGVMVAGAAIFLLTKRRMSGNVQ